MARRPGPPPAGASARMFQYTQRQVIAYKSEKENSIEIHHTGPDGKERLAGRIVYTKKSSPRGALGGPPVPGRCLHHQRD